MIRPSKWEMGFIFGLLLCLPGQGQTACRRGVEDLALRQVVARRDYDQALTLLLKDLPVTEEERQHVHIVKGLSAQNADSHGQADPDTGDIEIDVGLFGEGESGACQGLMHEFTHLRRFRLDQEQLDVYYADHLYKNTGWTGCESEDSPAQIRKNPIHKAYDCLEDNALITHAATADIEAVLAQRPYAEHGILRDEDIAYLQDNLRQWTENRATIQSTSNTSYYVPPIKEQDIQFYCRGISFIEKLGLLNATLKQGQGVYCSADNLKQ